MKKITVLALLSTLFCAPVFASFPQHIHTCLVVHNNGLGSPLQASFVSSDILDGGSQTGPVRSGSQTCVQHTYHYGPKKIRLTVEASDASLRKDTAFFPDSNCTYMKNKKNGQAQSNYILTHDNHEIWQFTLRQIESRNGFRYSYQLSCEHTSH